MKMRKDAGAITSVVPGGGKPKFFFQLKLEGAGAEVKGAKKAAASKSNGAPASKGEKKKAKDDAGGDPISASIKQRKDAGSYVTVVKNDMVFKEPPEVFNLALQGKGAKINDSPKKSKK